MPTRLSPPIGLLSPTQTHDPAAAAARLAARLFEGAGAAIFVVGPVREHAAGDASLADAAAALARRVVHDGAPLAEPPAGPSMHAGYPLFAADGDVIGALAVAAPKPLDDDGLEALADLARASAAELALLDATRALDDLLDHTTDMACAVDGDGRIARANHAWCVALDRGRAVRLVESPGGTGRPLADLLAPEHRAPAAALLRRLGAGGAPEDVELVLVAPDGSRVVARGRAVPRPDRGRGAGMRLALRNLTAERHAQDMRARLAATLDASSDVCFMATARGDLVYLNDAGRRIAGLSADAPLASRRLADLWAGADARRVTREIIPAAQRDLIWQGEAELAAAEGGPVPVSAVIVAHPSAIPNEPPFFISGVLRDLRERQRAEAEMALLYRVPHLVSTADDVDSALLTALDAMCEAAAWDYGEVWLPAPSADGAAPTMRQGPAWCNPRDAKLVAFAREGASLGVRRGEGTVGRAWATGEAEWVGQPDVEPDLARDGAARRAGLRAAAAVPVVVGDETVAVLCFVGRHPRDGESARLELLAAVGAQMGAAVLRRQAESRLTADREFLTALLESATDGILACDADGHVTVFNRAARELFGLDATLDPAAAKSAALALVSDADDRPLDPGRTPLQRARAGETLRGVELRVRPPGRAARTLVAGGRPIRVGDDIVGAVIAFRDVTDERRAKELKDQLISTASHELRTPLAAVRGALEVLEGKVGAAGAREAELLEMARRNTGHVMRLVDDLLDAERVESGAIPMEPDVQGAWDLLERAAESVQVVAEQAGVALDVERRDLAVWADADRAMQVLVNLVSNAVKFSPRGSRVALGAEGSEDWVTFWVRDRGRGVPADKREAIFNRFEQVDASDAREKGGAGLGLAIARAIVEQHGGRIWCESTLGEGSTFRFTLPTVAHSLKQRESGTR